MDSFIERFAWTLPIFAVLLVASAFLWAIETVSGNYGALVGVLGIIANLVGAWAVLSLWKERRHQNDRASGLDDSGQDE